MRVLQVVFFCPLFGLLSHKPMKNSISKPILKNPSACANFAISQYWKKNSTKPKS